MKHINPKVFAQTKNIIPKLEKIIGKEILYTNFWGDEYYIDVAKRTERALQKLDAQYGISETYPHIRPINLSKYPAFSIVDGRNKERPTWAAAVWDTFLTDDYIDFNKIKDSRNIIVASRQIGKTLFLTALMGAVAATGMTKAEGEKFFSQARNVLMYLGNFIDYDKIYKQKFSEFYPFNVVEAKVSKKVRGELGILDPNAFRMDSTGHRMVLPTGTISFDAVLAGPVTGRDGIDLVVIDEAQDIDRMTDAIRAFSRPVANRGGGVIYCGTPLPGWFEIKLKEITEKQAEEVSLGVPYEQRKYRAFNTTFFESGLFDEPRTHEILLSEYETYLNDPTGANGNEDVALKMVAQEMFCYFNNETLDMSPTYLFPAIRETPAKYLFTTGDRTPFADRSKYEVFVFMDFSSGATKDSDYNGILWIALNKHRQMFAFHEIMTKDGVKEIVAAMNAYNVATGVKVSAYYIDSAAANGGIKETNEVRKTFFKVYSDEGSKYGMTFRLAPKGLLAARLPYINLALELNPELPDVDGNLDNELSTQVSQNKTPKKLTYWERKELIEKGATDEEIAEAEAKKALEFKVDGEVVAPTVGHPRFFVSVKCPELFRRLQTVKLDKVIKHTEAGKEAVFKSANTIKDNDIVDCAIYGIMTLKDYYPNLENLGKNNNNYNNRSYGFSQGYRRNPYF